MKTELIRIEFKLTNGHRSIWLHEIEAYSVYSEAQVANALFVLRHPPTEIEGYRCASLLVTIKIRTGKDTWVAVPPARVESYLAGLLNALRVSHSKK